MQRRHSGTCDAFAASRRAFTLIELLVVVTIIVVLLALLTPAMDRAVYQAELVMCGTHQRGIAMGLIQYAGDHQRRYPHRATSTNNATVSQIVWKEQDDRVYYEGYIDNKLFEEPLLGDVVDYSPEATGTSNIVVAGIVPFNGVRFPAHQPMNKLGDRWTWTVEGETFAFDLLVGDVDRILNFDDYLVQSHPDPGGLGYMDKGQERPIGSNTWSFAYWYLPDTDRTPPDFQFTHSDASVERIEEMGFAPEDERMTAVPTYYLGNYFEAGYASEQRTHMPRP